MRDVYLLHQFLRLPWSGHRTSGIADEDWLKTWEPIGSGCQTALTPGMIRVQVNVDNWHMDVNDNSQAQEQNN